MPFDHHLGDAISNRRDPQRAHPAIALRYVDPPHRWRKVAARRQTIPKFIEVVFKISLKIRNHLAVYASRPLVGSDPLIGFPHLPFRNVIRLGSIHEGPPVAGCPLARAEQRNPFAPAPLQDLHHCRVGRGGAYRPASARSLKRLVQFSRKPLSYVGRANWRRLGRIPGTRWISRTRPKSAMRHEVGYRRNAVFRHRLLMKDHSRRSIHPSSLWNSFRTFAFR